MMSRTSIGISIMIDGPVISGCDPLPPETTMTIGYHPVSKCVVIIFTHPEQDRGMYWPITMEDAKKMSELLNSACEIAKTNRRLDS